MLKIVLILGYLLIDTPSLLARFASLSGFGTWTMFLGLYLALTLGIFAAAWIRHYALRLAIALAFALASLLQQSYEWTTSGPFTYQAFFNLYYASGSIEQAFAQHGSIILQALCASLLLFTGIALSPKNKAVPLKWTVTPPFVMMLLITAMLYTRGGEGTRALPASYPAISYTLFLGSEALTADHSPRAKPSLPIAHAPVTQDIVLIVDESISANYLDINHPNGVRSGLKTPPQNVKVVNFGYAAAIHNCSANSNVVLRFGGDQTTYQHAIKRGPSIWQFAKIAGLRTVFIDAQTQPDTLQNMMTVEERANIDDMVQFRDTPVVQRDMEIARLIAERTHNNTPEFIYVNKIGAHFPIADKFPSDMAKYQPTLPRKNTSMISWSSDRSDFSGSAEQWALYRNAYRNTLAWNVGTFFDRLLPAIDWDKATVIYTSDHGQDLHERGNAGKNTHCGTDYAAQEEGLVPLVILHTTKGYGVDWETNLKSNYNQSSAFRIFPSVLTAMGFNQDTIEAQFGPSLNKIGPNNFAYNVYFSPLLGKNPEYRKIDITDIAAPPLSDYRK